MLAWRSEVFGKLPGWCSSYRCDHVMDESRPPELCQHNPEDWHQLAIEDCGIRGNQVIVKDGLDVWGGIVFEFRDMIAPKLGIFILIQAGDLKWGISYARSMLVDSSRIGLTW